MTDNVNFVFKFGNHKEFTPYIGDGGMDLFPFDGLIPVALTAFRPFESKDNKFPSLKVAGVCSEEDCKGMRVMDSLLCGGKDKNGNDLGRQFVEFLLSSGTALENFLANAKNNIEAPIGDITAKLTGRTAYAEVERDMYDGREVSKVRRWVTEEAYKQAKTLGAHRRPPRKVVVGTPVAGAAATAMSAMGGAAAAANGTGAATTQGTLPLL